MTNTIADMKKTFASPDTTVIVFNDNDVLIINSAIETGKFNTSSTKKAREVLMSIAAIGDEIPWPAIDYLDGLPC